MYENPKTLKNPAKQQNESLKMFQTIRTAIWLSTTLLGMESRKKNMEPQMADNVVSLFVHQKISFISITPKSQVCFSDNRQHVFFYVMW